MLTFTSNDFETIRHEKIDIDKIEKYILIIIDGPSCHECLLKLENTIVSNSKIKTIIVFKADGNISWRFICNAGVPMLPGFENSKSFAL